MVHQTKTSWETSLAEQWEAFFHTSVWEARNKSLFMYLKSLFVFTPTKIKTHEQPWNNGNISFQKSDIQKKSLLLLNYFPINSKHIVVLKKTLWKGLNHKYRCFQIRTDAALNANLIFFFQVFINWGLQQIQLHVTNQRGDPTGGALTPLIQGFISSLCDSH